MQPIGCRQPAGHRNTTRQPTVQSICGRPLDTAARSNTPTREVYAGLREITVKKAGHALTDGHLLPPEITANVEQAAQQVIKVRENADKAHAQHHRLLDKRLSGVGAPMTRARYVGCGAS